MPDASPALEVRDLRKTYARREVVRGLSMVARAGRITAVLGPNGAGKTTTIECCEGLRRPDAGTVRVLGVDPADRAARPSLSERVGVMLQDGGLPQAPRAGAVLTHLSRLYRDPVPPAELLHRLNLEVVARTPVRRLSGGQRQRLALAGALVGRPEMVFLDEPSAGLDPQARLGVWELLREQRRSGTAMLLTTHLMDEAEALADDVVIVDGGRVVAEGSPDRLTGGTRVRATLTPRAAGRADQVVQEVGAALRAAGRPDLSVRTGRDGSVEVGAPDGSAVDAGTVLAATSALAAAGQADAAVELYRRTLEDVFLELTGHGLRGGGTAP